MKYLAIIAIITALFLLTAEHNDAKLEQLQQINDKLTYLLTLEPVEEEQSIQGYAVMRAEWAGINTDSFLKLIECESNFNPEAKNPNSSAYGIMQYTDATWSETLSSYRGIGRENPYASINEAVIDIANMEAWRWSECLDKYNLTF